MNDDQIMSTIIQTIKEKYSLKISNVFKKYINDEAVDIENLEIDLEDLAESFLISYMVDEFQWEHDEINRFCLLIRKCLDPNIAELTRMPTCLAKANMPSEYLVRGYLRKIEEDCRMRCLQNYTSNSQPNQPPCSHTPTDEYDDEFNPKTLIKQDGKSLETLEIQDLNKSSSQTIHHRLHNSYSISVSEKTAGESSMSPLLMPFVLARSYSMMTIPEEITRLCVKYLQEICVYAIGRNDRGEFGIPGRRNFTQLTELEWITNEENFSLFTIIPCTLNGIAYISESRNLYVCGFNKWAQFGLGHAEHAVEVPTLHTFYEKHGMKITYVSHGQRAYHMFVMTNDGSIYAHGANEWGQLGLNRVQNKEMEPVRLQVGMWMAQPKTTVIKQITCGIEHSIFLTSFVNYFLMSFFLSEI